MFNWLIKIVDNKNQIRKGSMNGSRQIDFEKISTDWNADPVSPEIELEINGDDLVMDIYVNYYVFEKFKEGDRVKIRFIKCSQYSLNTCNDEGYYRGQYRITPNELPWGEFYEIRSGLDRNYPEPIITIQDDKTNKRHFIFFFKDETFECLASDYELEYYNEHKD